MRHALRHCMSTYISTRNIYIAASMVLVAACDIQAEPSVTDHVTLKSRAGDLRALEDLTIQVIDRLHERDISLDEAEAVAESGDEEAARELLGMDDDEVQELYDRLLAIQERIERGGSRGRGGGRGGGGGIGDPDRGNPHVNIRDSDCSRHYNSCLLGAIVAAGNTATPTTALVTFGVAGYLCMCTQCSGGINDYICPRRWRWSL